MIYRLVWLKPNINTVDHAPDSTPHLMCHLHTEHCGLHCGVVHVDYFSFMDRNFGNSWSNLVWKLCVKKWSCAIWWNILDDKIKTPIVSYYTLLLVSCPKHNKSFLPPTQESRERMWREFTDEKNKNHNYLFAEIGNIVVSCYSAVQCIFFLNRNKHVTLWTGLISKVFLSQPQRSRHRSQKW